MYFYFNVYLRLKTRPRLGGDWLWINSTGIPGYLSPYFSIIFKLENTVIIFRAAEQ